MSDDDIKNVIKRHHSHSCPSYTGNQHWIICLINYYKMFYFGLEFLCKRIPAILMVITSLWLMGLFGSANAEEVIPERVYDDKELMQIAEVMKEKLLNGTEPCERINRACTLYSMIPLIIVFLTHFFICVFAGIMACIILEYRGIGEDNKCPYCSRFLRLHEDWGSHKCKKVMCPKCNLVLGFNSEYSEPRMAAEFKLTHTDSCVWIKKGKWQRPSEPVDQYKKEIRKRNVRAMKFSIPTFMLLTLIILVNCVNADHNIEMMKQESDLGEFIKEIQKEGFHPYHARFSKGAREDITAAVVENDCSEESCHLLMKLKTKIMLREGRESGFRVCPDKLKKEKEMKNDGCVDLNIKIRNTIAMCWYKDEYRTGPVKHIQFSSDTCTESCGACQRSLETYKKQVKGDIFEMNHENTASWSCDGPGCMAINQGCTCGACSCELKEEEFEVLQKVKEEPQFELCLQVGGEGFCKFMSREEKGMKVKVLKYGETTNLCPTRIACKNWKKSPTCLTGEINKKGEFDEKFGSVQKIGNFTSLKREERFQEHCLFAKHRWVSYDQCCKDTYHMIHELEPAHLNKWDEKNKYVLNADDVGSWEIEIEVPKITYTKKIDKISIKNLSIKDCKGCFSCDEGGACNLIYTSNLDSNLAFECHGCSTDMSHLLIKKGVQSKPFNVFCKDKEGTIKCKLGNFTAETKFRLLEKPRQPHGDGVISMDKEKFINEKCESFICGLNFTWLGLWKYMKWVLLGLGCVVLALLLYKVISSVTRVMGKAKKAM